MLKRAPMLSVSSQGSIHVRGLGKRALMFCPECRTTQGFYSLTALKVASLKVTDSDRVWMEVYAQIGCTSCGKTIKELPFSESFKVAGDDEYSDRSCDILECDLPEARVKLVRYEGREQRKTEYFGLKVQRFLWIDLWIEKTCQCGDWRWPDTVHFVASEEAIDSHTKAPPPTAQHRWNANEGFSEAMRKHAEYLAPYKGMALFIKVEEVSRDSISLDGSRVAHSDPRCEVLQQTGRHSRIGVLVEGVEIREHHFVSKDGREYSGRLCERCVSAPR